MTESRPYRFANQLALARLTQVKAISLSSFLALALLSSALITQQVARMFGYSPALGPSLVGRLYAPWDWIVWWSRWHDAEQLERLWALCAREAIYALAVLSTLAAAAIFIARSALRTTKADLHGSARWATTRDMRAAGFITPPNYLPRFIQRLAVRCGILKRRPARFGIYLGIWRPSWWRSWYLRDCGPGHVLVVAPTRSGKGVGVVQPTLLTWRHSALIHDLKGENWNLTAGARQRMGQLCLKFDPTDPSGASVKYNPLEEVRLRTPYETEDAQNIAHMIVDPDGKGLHNHWLLTGAALLTAAILHLLYAEPNKTLRGLAGFLANPGRTPTETFQRMLTTTHDPDGLMQWCDAGGHPTRTHPVVAESLSEVLGKGEDDRAGVYSTVMSFLWLYRDPIVAANTAYSEFRISDLVNHERPVSLYLVVPMASRDRLRPLTRLMLNQIIRTLTTSLVYQDGRALSANRHPLLLMLDEFPILGHLEVLAEALSFMAGYGIRACLVAQDMTQIYRTYGHDESITGHCDTRVAYTPNKLETAQDLSRMVGETSVPYNHRTVSKGGVSTSEMEAARPLMTPDEIRRMDAREVLIFSRGHPAIRAQQLRHHTQPFFRRRGAIKPPATSDRIADSRGAIESPRPVTDPNTACPHNPRIEERPAEVPDASKTRANADAAGVRFLKFATDQASGSKKR